MGTRSLQQAIRLVSKRLAERAALCLLVAALAITSLSAATVTVFGPKTYKRTNGRPDTFSNTFTVTNAVLPYVLHLTNNGVNSAEVRINGELILRHRDFVTHRGRDGREHNDRHDRDEDRDDRDRDADRDCDNDHGRGDHERENHDRTPVATIDEPVTLKKGTNKIQVELDGKRNTSFSIVISSGAGTTDTTPPTITAVQSPLPNANGWNNTPVTVTFTCADNTAVASCPAPVTVSTEGNQQIVKGTATDTAGNTAVASVTINLDRTAPIVTAAAAPAANANGWNNTPVTVSFAATDALSGLAAGSTTSPIVLNTDGSNLSASGQAIDRAGNVGQAQKTGIKIDRVAPTISFALDSAPGAGGYFSHPVGVQFTCADAASGVQTCPPAEVVSTEGTQNVTRTAVDNAGNTASTSTGPLLIDLSAPSITATLSPPANAQGWNKTPVTVHFSCSDPGAGIAICPADQVLSEDGAGQTVTGTTTDKAGQTASVTTPAINVDQAPPEVLVQMNQTPNANGWFNTAVNVHFECADATSGVETCAPDQLVSNDGAQTLTVTVVDRAGNSATVSSAPIRIDTTLPTITATTTPPPNQNGWNSGPVTVHFTCADGGSGLVECPPDQVISDEGADQSVTGTVADNAGNNAFAFAAVHIDKTPPTLTLTGPTLGLVLLTPTVSAVGNVSDELSGLETVTCNDAPATVDGDKLDCTIELSRGANSISATATDQAGNQTSVGVGVTYARVPVIHITSPTALGYTNISPTTVTGTVDDPTAVVMINSVAAPAANGEFTLALPLAEGPNTITATATSPEGGVGSASLIVTLDTTAPHVTITSPPDGFATSEASVSIAGIVNDIVVGTVNDEQAQITVNGVPAQVANRTFSAADVPLTPGQNLIQAIGRDRVGNSVTTEITVTRRVLAAAQIHLVSGNNQVAAIGAPVALPLVVSLVDGSGNPVPNTPVIFKVTQNDGTLVAGEGDGPSVVAMTNPQGLASARWTLGHRAGAGGNAVEASAVGFEGLAVFTARATQGTAAKIVVDTGNDQVGLISQPLPKPFIAVVIDEGNNRLAGVPVTFSAIQGGGTFNGEPTLDVVTDSDGRAAATLTLGPEEGNASNFVQATFPDNPGLAAAFFSSSRIPGNPASTSISGVVVDNSNVPLPGVTVRAVLTDVLHSNNVAANQATSVQTDAQGQFEIKPAPVGFVKLIIDGATATAPGSYPTLEYDMVTVVGQNNTVGAPIYMVAINNDNQLCVDPSDPTKAGGTLTIPEAPGFSLSFKAGQVTFPGGSQVGCISVTVVNGDKVPMVPGFGQQPRFIVTIQPSGALFNPPAEITIPNVDGLAPRAVTEMYSYDHDIASFVAIGTGVVSDDGLVIKSSPGVGVLKAGWHCGGNPNATGVAANCPVCQTCKTDHCEADPGKNGQEVPTDKCKICQNGSPKSVDLLPIGGELSYTFGPPETATKTINDALKKLEPLGVIAKVSLLQVTGKISGKECCDPANGKGKGVEYAGSVTGDFGGFSVKAKIWPPGPIPTVEASLEVVGVAKLSAKAQFVGGVFFNLSGKVTGQIGYKKKECSKNADDQAGCVHGKVEIGLTPGLSAEVGGNASITFECFLCGEKTSFAIAGALLIGDFSWPISIAGVQFNEASCSAGVTGGFFNPGKGSFKIAAKFSGSYSSSVTGSRKIDIQINFLSCSISGDGVTCSAG